MTHVISVGSVSDALQQALVYMLEHGVSEDSRNGKVIVAPGPVITEYRTPKRRVLLSPMRNANPFFHFMEGLWMLSGSDDVAFPKLFNSRFGEYSTDGVTLHGAYGHRWRKAFGFDQLQSIAAGLREDRNSRRQVLQMWDVERDLNNTEASADTPCNTHAYFDVRGGLLNMTVCCRSNDAIWGAYGANAVHMSMMMEVMASMVGVGVGVYRQMSNNFHIYESVLAKSEYQDMVNDIEDNRGGAYNTFRLVKRPNQHDCGQWFDELAMFLDKPQAKHQYLQPLFNLVAAPMYQAWYLYKAGELDEAIREAETIYDYDWALACTQWLERVKVKRGATV